MMTFEMTSEVAVVASGLEVVAERVRVILLNLIARNQRPPLVLLRRGPRPEVGKSDCIAHCSKGIDSGERKKEKSSIDLRLSLYLKHGF